MYGRRIIVTGASSGLGQAIAARLVRDGAQVVGTSRTAPTEGAIGAAGLTMVALDICDDASVDGFAARLGAAGIVPQTIFLNAGSGIAGAIEATPANVALAQLDTNLVGAHRVVRAILPALREAGCGHLIFIGSIAGRIALPFQAIYSASKAALAAYVEALRVELRPFGISVTLIEPGDHNTDFPERRQTQDGDAASPYQPLQSRVLAAMVASERAGAPPATLADLVARIVAAPRPPRRALKISAVERLSVVLRALLPDAGFEAMLRRVYKIP